MIEATMRTWADLMDCSQQTFDLHEQLTDDPALLTDPEFRLQLQAAIKERDRAEKAHVVALREAYEQRLARQRAVTG